MPLNWVSTMFWTKASTWPCVTVMPSFAATASRMRWRVCEVSEATVAAFSSKVTPVIEAISVCTSPATSATWASVTVWSPTMDAAPAWEASSR